MAVEEKVDPVELWREEISQEFREWLDKFDKEGYIALLLAKLEKRSPEDFFGEDFYNETPGHMIGKLNEMGIQYPLKPVRSFYYAFHNILKVKGLYIL